MSSKPVLRLDWCTAEAARFAVMHWHYSKRMPMPPHVRVGAWEDDRFIGCVLFGRGASLALGAAFGCNATESCELVRVALTDHVHEVTRIVAIAIRFLRKQNPGLQLVISFADPERGHVGAIYQAGGWVYTGESNPTKLWWYQGRWQHTREFTGGAFGGPRKRADTKGIEYRIASGKHRYLYPLTQEMRERVQKLAKPYPKKTCPGKGSLDGTTVEEGGSIPTPGLQDDEAGA